MRAALVLTLGLLLSSCEAPVGATDISGSVHRYFELPDKILTVLGQNVSDEEKRLDLAGLGNACCTGQLEARLLRWFSETPMNSGSFFDDIQSMRPINKPTCQPVVLTDDRNATITCRIETSESYSLARNLENVAALYNQFDIRNVTLDEVSAEIKAQELPELVELVVQVQKAVELQIQAIDDDWLVSDVNVSSNGARIEVRLPR